MVMKELIKKILFKLGLLDVVRKLDPFHSAQTSENNKRKQDAVLAAKKQFTPDIFIETGTYLGDMVYAMQGYFERLYSIELSTELYQNAKKRFAAQPHITILNGDSGAILSELMATIHEPVLFWLDAHYSAGITAKGDLDTPISKELEIIFNHPVTNHVILIDDARLFVGKDSYPTIAALEKLVADHGAKYDLSVSDDIIRLYPKKSSAGL